MLFPRVAVPIFIPNNSGRTVPFLHILTDTSYLLSFDDSHFGRCKVMPHCGFDLHFLDD